MSEGLRLGRLQLHESARWKLFERMEIPDYHDPSGPVYLTRWRLLETPWLGVFVHRMSKPDPSETLHDHPWSFISLVMLGGYIERVAASIDPSLERAGYDERVQVVADRSGTDRLETAHRRVRWVNVKWSGATKRGLHSIRTLLRTPTWTLLVIGPRRRVWGYVDDDGTWTAWDRHPIHGRILEVQQSPSRD